jgi:chromosome segregation ATPase
MLENNQLHMEIIRLKEGMQSQGGDLTQRMKQVESECDDLKFVAHQKENRISQLEKENNEMRQKLQQALQATQYKNSTEIQKIFSDKRGPEHQEAQFEMTRALDGGASGNQRDNEEFRLQQDLWAQELKKADARAQKFKEDLDRLAEDKRELRSESVALQEKVFAREQEIQRLQQSYRGGQNFDGVKQNFDDDRFQQEHDQMKGCLNRIGTILGVHMASIESTDDLVTQVDRLQHANHDLREDNQELDRMVQDLRLNQNNQADAGRMISQDQDVQLKRIIHETEQRFNQVEAENRRLRDELDKKDAYQGSVQSHNKLYLERVQDLEQEANSHKTQVANLKQQLREQESEQSRLCEEVNMYKGRCANLQRDMEFSSTTMDKLNTNKDGLDVQLNHYKHRVAQLEEENVKLTEEKTDQLYEIRRLTNDVEKTQKNYEQLQRESMKSQGDQHVSNATTTRLQTQLNQTQKDLDLMNNQKIELENIIKKQKEDIIEAQNKSTEYYN